MATHMGSIDIDRLKLEEINNTHLSSVIEKSSQILPYFDQLEGANKHTHVKQLLSLVVRSAQIASDNLHDKSESEKIGPEYYQALVALDTLKDLLVVYISDPKDENFKKVSEACGHIIDRISQKLLDCLGRSEVHSFYKILAAEQKKLLSLMESLHQSALALKSFVNIQAESALHTELTKEVSRKKAVSVFWLLVFVVSNGFLFWIAKESIWVVPDFLKNLTVPEHGSSIFIILSLAPRILITVILLFFSAASWKIYHAYQHLLVSLRRKELAAKLIPTLLIGVDNSRQYEIKEAFLLKLLEQEDTGFISQTKTSGNPMAGLVKAID